MSSTTKLADRFFSNEPVVSSPSCMEWVAATEKDHIRIEAHAPGVFRLRYGAADWLQPAKPTARRRRHAQMLITRDEPVGEFDVRNSDAAGWRLNQGEAGLRLQAEQPHVSLWQGDDCIVRINLERLPSNGGFKVDFLLAADEGIHGLGETCGALDRRGARLRSDRPQDRCLPLAWSTRGWGAYLNTYAAVEHDITRENRYTATADIEGLDLFLFVGRPPEILDQYTTLTGRAGQPDLWPMGIWLDQAPGQDIQESLQQVRQLREAGMALDALVLAEPAILGFQADKPVFEWSNRIPDWREFHSQAQDLNIQLLGSCIPGVLQGTLLFDEWEDRGWLLCDENGDAWVCPGTPASGGQAFGLLDLTHKDVRKLWTERHLQAVEEGLAAPVCQASFDIPDNVQARGGEEAGVLRTIYPLLARQAIFDAVAGPRTPQEGVMPSRDLFPGVQRFAWQQGPEVDNSWEGYAASLRAALSVGNCGVALQMHRLGNAKRPTDELTPELYLRWLAMCVFSGNFSFQGLPALMPDSFDAETRELIVHWLEWRYRLLPYVAGIIDDAVRSGLTAQISMAQAFPEDALAHTWDTQYMLGPALLVAPVMQPGKEVELYLPGGSGWWDLTTGWRYEGGQRLHLQAELDYIPVFGREGHMLCLGSTAQHVGEINSARILEEVWMFGMPEHNPVVMRNKIRVMQMQGSSYIKGLEGLRILPSEGLEVKRRGAEVRISRAR